MAFRRKAEPIVSAPIVPESIVPEPESATGDESVAHVFSRVDGPWDLAEVSDNVERIDFGALQFAPRDGLEEVDAGGAPDLAARELQRPGGWRAPCGRQRPPRCSSA